MCNCSNVIYQSGPKLGSPLWEIGASPIRYRINKSSKPLLRIDKLIFTRVQWQVLEATTKLKQPPTLSFSLSHPLQPRHIPNASGHCLSIQSVRMSPTIFVMLAIFMSTFTCIYFMSNFFSRSTFLVATESGALHITWSGLIT